MLSAQMLLEGAWYAVEQAGRLLQSAVTLFESDPSSALALAMFGREEMERSKLLRELAKEVRGGQTTTVKDVRRRCKPHTDKQRAGAGSVQFSPEPGTALHAAMSARIKHDINSKEYAEAEKVIDAAVADAVERYPQERHLARMAALYVDLDHGGRAWKRPVLSDKEAIRQIIVHAVNDYSVRCSNLEPGIIHIYNQDMADALAVMEPKPSLPPPVWPNLLGS